MDEFLGNLDGELFNDFYHSTSDSTRSNYFTIANYNHTFNGVGNSIFLCNYNIRSFHANFDNFEAFLYSLSTKFNLLVLTETRFAAGSGVDIAGYSGFHVGRVGGAGGGVSVYSDVVLNAHKVPHLSFVSEYLEMCVVKMKIIGRDIVIIAVYRPPNGRLDDFVNSMITVLNDSIVCNSEIILTGDLNIDLTDYENAHYDVGNFVNIMFSHCFVPKITRPTRFPSGEQHGSPSILDHIWYNKCNSVDSGILIFDATDHFPTFIVIKNILLSGSDLVEVKFRDKIVC